MTRKIVTIIFSVLFIGTMFGSLFHVGGGMNPRASERGCPFMTSGESICSMNASDHIAAWQDNFLTIPPLLFLIVGIVVLAILLVRTYPRLVYALDTIYFFSPSFFFIQRMCNIPQRGLQDFFARGILHPKLH